MKEFLGFLKNRTVHKHLILAFVGLFLFIEFIFLGLRIYTRHGQALSVPDFYGLNLSEVAKLTDQKDLRFVVTDSNFIQGAVPGTVVAQNPSPNTKVKVNRTIFLTINAFNPEKVDMPNVVGVSLRQAEAIIQSKGLRVGARRYIPNIAKDYVLRQVFHGRDIKPGTPIIKGSGVDLILGLGPGSQKVAVPDLKRLTLVQAQEVVSTMYINIGAIIPDNSIETQEDSLKAIIWKQTPAYGSSINVGESINVWLTVEQPKPGAENDSTPKNDE